MRNKFLILIFLLFSTVNLIQAQKKFEVLKIDKNDLDTMNVIYLKKISFLDNGIYRIITHKSDSLIVNNKEIIVGDVLKLKLIKAKKYKVFREDFIPEPDKKSFFYYDTYEGKNVNINYYCPSLAQASRL